MEIGLIVKIDAKKNGELMKRLLLLGLMLGAISIFAQNVQQFGYSLNNTYAIHEGAELGPSIIPETYTKYNLILVANLFYADDPVVVKAGVDRDERIGVLTSNHTGINFGLGFFLTPRILLGATTTFTRSTNNIYSNYNVSVTSPAAFETITEEEEETALGDILVTGKIALGSPNKNSRFALIPTVRIPTGSEESFTTDRSVGFGLDLAADFKMSFMQLGLSIGYHYASDAQYYIPAGTPINIFSDIETDLDYTQKIKTSIGSYIPVSDVFGFNLEYIRYWTLPLSDIQNPNELYGGIRWQASRGVAVFAGGSVGNFEQADGNDYRLVAGLKITTPRVAPAPVAPAPEPVLAKVQAYDDQATTAFNTPVDVDILTNDDISAIVGQPSLRIVSMTHPNNTRCEIINSPLGVRFTPLANFIGTATCRYEVCSAEGMCSQADLVVTVLQPEAQYGDLTWNKSIYFCNDCDNINARSHQVLDELVKYLQVKGSRVTKIIIEGHTSLRASAAYNLALSKRRAKNTYKELLKRGVNPQILQMVAYGESRPEIPGSDTTTKHPTNRRVEFRIYEQ